MAILDKHRVCSICREVKPLTAFHLARSQKKGVRSECKVCGLAWNQRYYQGPIGRIIRRKYRDRNREKENAQQTARRAAKRSLLPVVVRPTREQIKKARHRRRYLKHREQLKRKSREYRLANLDRIRIRKSEHQRRRRATDPAFAMAHRLSCRIRMAVKAQSGIKARKSMDLLGCSVPDFILYLESKFETGMSWENYGKGPGKWEIDHIIPCALFDLTREEHQKRCFHFSNQQPMWALDNQKKGTTILLSLPV